MLKINKAVLILAAIFVAVTSCNNSEDGSSEASIKSLALGKFNVMHNDVTVDGKDTTVIDEIVSGIYEFDIDSKKNLIYNTDTLPFGSILSSVSTEISASGNVFYVVPDSNGVIQTVPWTKDFKIDLTVPVPIKVISTDNSYTREYMLSANVYQADPDSMSWNKVTSRLPDGLVPANAVAYNKGITLMGIDSDGSPCTVWMDRSGKTTEMTRCTGLSQNADLKSVSTHNGEFIIADNNRICISSDCINWSTVGQENGIGTLIPFLQTGDGGTAWAITTDGWMASSTDLCSWTKVQKVPEDFPDREITAFCYPLENNRNIIRYLLIGNKTDADEALIWTKLSTESIWVKVEAAKNHSLKCPAFNNLSLIKYDNRLYAFGGKGRLGKDTVTAMSNFYESRDNGISWRECKSLIESFNTWNNFMQIPDAYKGYDGPFRTVVDSTNTIWLISSERGVWTGFINRLYKD